MGQTNTSRKFAFAQWMNPVNGNFYSFENHFFEHSGLHGFTNVLICTGIYYVIKKTFTITSVVTEAIDTFIISRFTERTNNWWIQQYGPWAVITGGCEGIGRGYAEELAQHGLNVVIISNNYLRLVETKADIESKYNVHVEYIVADFSADDQNTLYSGIKKTLAGKDIGLVVNNVGTMYELPDLVLEVPRDRLWELIHVNIVAAVMMTHMLLPGLLARGRGGVVVVSAGSSTKITPKMTVYSATKRFLDYFIQGVAFEYRDSGLTFQCLLPFYVATKLKGFGDLLTRRNWFVPSGRDYARSAVRTLGRSPLTTGYFAHSLQWWLSYMVPEWLWMWGAEKLYDFTTRHYTRRRRDSRKLELT